MTGSAWNDVPSREAPDCSELRNLFAKEIRKVAVSNRKEEITLCPPKCLGLSGSLKWESSGVSTALSGARAQNIGIVLSFLKLPGDQIVRHIEDMTYFGVEEVEGLIGILPTEAEIAALRVEEKSIRSGKRFFHWGPVHEFAYGASKGNCGEILSTWKTLLTLPSRIETAVATFSEYNKLSGIFLDPQRHPHFLDLLSLVRSIGNALNAGTRHGNAAAFKMSSLLTLSTLKGNNGASLLAYLVQYIAGVDEEIFRFIDEISGANLLVKKGLSEEHISIEAEAVREEFASLCDSVGGGGGGGGGVFPVGSAIGRRVRAFVAEYKPKVAKLLSSAKSLVGRASTLQTRFGEDPRTFNEVAFYSVIADFRKEFVAAHIGFMKTTKTAPKTLPKEKTQDKQNPQHPTSIVTAVLALLCIVQDIPLEETDALSSTLPMEDLPDVTVDDVEWAVSVSGTEPDEEEGEEEDEPLLVSHSVTSEYFPAHSDNMSDCVDTSSLCVSCGCALSSEGVMGVGGGRMEGEEVEKVPVFRFAFLSFLFLVVFVVAVYASVVLCVSILQKLEVSTLQPLRSLDAGFAVFVETLEAVNTLLQQLLSKGAGGENSVEWRPSYFFDLSLFFPVKVVKGLPWDGCMDAMVRAAVLGAGRQFVQRAQGEDFTSLLSTDCAQSIYNSNPYHTDLAPSHPLSSVAWLHGADHSLDVLADIQGGQKNIAALPREGRHLVKVDEKAEQETGMRSGIVSNECGGGGGVGMEEAEERQVGRQYSVPMVAPSVEVSVAAKSVVVLGAEVAEVVLKASLLALPPALVCAGKGGKCFVQKTPTEQRYVQKASTALIVL